MKHDNISMAAEAAVMGGGQLIHNSAIIILGRLNISFKVSHQPAVRRRVPYYCPSAVRHGVVVITKLIAMGGSISFDVYMSIYLLLLDICSTSRPSLRLWESSNI